MTNTTSRPLGSDQRMAVMALVDHGRSTNWCIDNQSKTLRVLESLERRGLADRKGTRADFFPTPEAKELRKSLTH